MAMPLKVGIDLERMFAAAQSFEIETSGNFSKKYVFFLIF